jgi:colanic acid biosynthesis glycosyl transferase WcaI
VRVLIVSQYFAPEMTAAANRLHAFAAGLVRRGHEVEVVCEVPHHPVGVVAKGYGGRLVDRREMDGATVRYVWVHLASSKDSRGSRLANYVSFGFTGTIVACATRRPDVILASSPPLPVGGVGLAVAARRRRPWVMDVRDLWPDAAVALGQVVDGPLLRAAQRFERCLYRSAAAITVTTVPSGRQVETRGGAGKVAVVPNGTTAEFLEAGARAPTKGVLGDRDDLFRWTYAGNLGMVAGLETAIDAARELGEGFQLVLIGDGSRRNDLERLASDLPSDQVVFHDAVPPTEAAELMRASDALLASRAPAPELDGMVLSKLYDCCAVGRPVIVSAAGETSRLATEAAAGLSIRPGNAGELASAVRRIRDDDGLRKRLATGARAFGEANAREGGVAELERVLRGVVEAHPARTRRIRQGQGAKEA